MGPRSRSSKKAFKRLRKPQQPHVHRRAKAGACLTSRAFDALCIDVLRRKAGVVKQRINDHALRVLWRECVTSRKSQPTKSALWKRLMDVFDQCAAIVIGFNELPFSMDDEKLWHLAPGTSQRQPEQWAIRRIVGSFIKDGVRYYEVEWENTTEPKSYIPTHLIRKYERAQRRKVEKTFVEVEACEAQGEDQE